jgi:ligand-binding sensor domain-containing protein/signal transduction histidine kinase
MPSFIIKRLWRISFDTNGFVTKAVLWLVCIVIINLPQAVAAQYQFNSWSTDNGLPENAINALLQTRDGYLWLTTSDGLVRFDGVRFTVFKRGTTKGLDSNRLMTLFEDREGALWIGTEDRGIVRYRDGLFTSYTTEDGLPSTHAASFMEDRDGKLLIRMSNSIIEWQGEKFVPYSVEYDIKPAPGIASAGSANYQSFSFYDRNGVHRYEGGRYRTYSVNEGLPEGRPKSVYQDAQKTLWISTSDKQLFKLKAESSRVEPVEIKGGLPDDHVDAVFDDGRGALWLSTWPSGLARLSGGTLIPYQTEQGFSGKRVTRFYEDREGNIWLGTYNQGLYQISRQSIAEYINRDSQAVNNIYTTYEDHKGTIWIGTWGGGLSSLRDGKFTNYIETKNISSTHITALFEDSEKALWVGTNNFGLNRLKDGQWTTFKLKDGLSNDSIYAIQQDREGALWVGTNSGVNRYKDGSFTAFNTAEGLPHRRVQVIHEDRAGNLWLGTLGGLSRLKDGRFTNISEKDGLSSNHVRSIYEDSDGAIWVGTYDSGLNRLKNGKITRYSEKDGLYNDGVFQILEDQEGYFWISCNRGIYRVSRKELNDFADGKIQAVTSVSFDKRDGMPSSECNGGYQPAGIKTRDGRLLFPTQGGLAVVDPSAIRLNTQPPPVVIEDIIVDRQPLMPRDKLEISPGQDNLEIRYTGLSFIKPDSIRFKYKLEGLDKEWIEAGSRRAAYYSYLPPGEYSFTVIAANSGGVWNTAGATVRVVVHPPFWRTWWFITLAALGVVCAVIFIYHYRVIRLKKAHAAQEAFSRQLIESQETERKRIAAELHDSIGQSLAIIKNRAALSLSQRDDHGRAIEQLDEISMAATFAIDEVREIAYNLRPFQLDRLGLTKALEAMLKRAGSDGLDFRFQIDQIDNIFSEESEINLYRIVQESIGNIVKHSEATEAAVVVRRAEREIEITVQDNGKGFNSDVGHQSEPGQGGFGLVGIAERVRMLRGRLSIHSAPGRGTLINIKLDLKDKR